MNTFRLTLLVIAGLACSWSFWFAIWLGTAEIGLRTTFEHRPAIEGGPR